MSNKLNYNYIVIKETFNNYFVTVTDNNGAVLFWKTSSSLGFLNKLKSSKTAVYELAKFTAKKLLILNKKSSDSSLPYAVKLFGFRKKFKLFLRALVQLNKKIIIKKIFLISRIPHNGCKVQKRKHKNYYKRKKKNR